MKGTCRLSDKFMNSYKEVQKERDIQSNVQSTVSNIGTLIFFSEEKFADMWSSVLIKDMKG